MANSRHGSSSRQGGEPGSGGFTMVELLTAIAVLAVLLALAVPNFNDATLSARLHGFANSLVASAQIARSEAIKRNSNITLCASANGTTCAPAGAVGWEQGWIVLNGATVLQRQQALPTQFKVKQAGGRRAEPPHFSADGRGCHECHSDRLPIDSRRQRGTRRHHQRHRCRLREDNDRGILLVGLPAV